MADQPSSNPVDAHAEASPAQSDATQQQTTHVSHEDAIVEKKGSPITQMIDKDGGYMYVLRANNCFSTKSRLRYLWEHTWTIFIALQIFLI